MKACVQRVQSASVTVEGAVVSRIERGLLVLLGVARHDAPADAELLARKLVELRIFEDDAGKMNRGLVDIGGQMLVVSQFTLLADCRKGRRPSFVEAAAPALAEQLYLHFVEAVRARGIQTATGQFRAHMDVALVNDGPVTLILDSRDSRDG